MSLIFILPEYSLELADVMLFWGFSLFWGVQKSSASFSSSSVYWPHTIGIKHSTTSERLHMLYSSCWGFKALTMSPKF